MSFKSAQRFAAAFTAAAVLLSSASVLPLNVHAAMAIPTPSRTWNKDGYTTATGFRTIKAMNSTWSMILSAFTVNGTTLKTTTSEKVTA
jgi:hypothetical protein